MLNRGFVRDFGTIQQYNFKLARQNFNGVRFALDYDNNKLNGDANELTYDGTDCTPDMDEIRSLVKVSKQILADARELQIAASDLEATAKGLFPSELAPVKNVCGKDPRDWFFDFVNIGNCHDCPLHAGLTNLDKHICACGAKECIVKQLCEMVGRYEY